MDRLGRAMIDFSPHIAMMGADLENFSSLLNFNGLSTLTMNGSI